MQPIYISLISILVTGGLFSFLQFLITRRDKKKEKKSEFASFKAELETLKCDACRTQLLLLIKDFPTETQEIMKVAYRYFSELGGDWYMTNLFNKWLIQNNIGKPEWFDTEN